MNEKTHHRVIIIGSGPAGLTAAIYTSRADLRPLVIEGVAAGGPAGGQLMTTTDVENYPGFPDGVTGPEMMEKFKAQAARFGTKFLLEDVTGVDFQTRPFTVETGDGKLTAEAVIISTGATARYLGIPSEEQFKNRGISACATCDGAFFKGKEVAVVGGGDTALEEALYLTRLCPKVTVIHRRDQLRASKIMAERGSKSDRIEFLWNSVIEEYLGPPDGMLEAIRIKNVKTQESHDMPIGGVFVAIGHKPNTDLFKGQLEMNDVGYLLTRNGSTATNIPGVFACGDAQDAVYRQAVTAAGTGCMAAIDAERWLESQAG